MLSKCVIFKCISLASVIVNLVPRIFLWERPWLRLVTCLIKNLAPEGVWGKYQITSTCFQWDIRSKYLLIFVCFLCFEFARTFLHSYLQSSQETKQVVTRSALSCCYIFNACSLHTRARL